MKIWIGYADCGNGHRMAAEAVYQAFSADEQPVCYLLDILEQSNAFVRFIYKTGYRFLVLHLPLLWKLFYYFYNHKWTSRLFSIDNLLVFRGLVRELKKENPDIVISCHFFVSRIVSFLKRKGRITSRLITVITDFKPHWLWLTINTDCYIVASEYSKEELLKKIAVSPLSVKPWGIPLRPEFYSRYKLRDLEEKYGRPQGLPTVMLFSSDFAVGPLKKIVSRFYRLWGLIIIYGNNKAFKRYLDRLSDAKYILALPRTDSIAEIMALSDAIALKAGGLSVSECLALKKPPVVLYAFPGQEEENADFIAKNRLGFYPRDTKELLALIEMVLRGNPMTEAVRNNINIYNSSNSAEKIRGLLLSYVRGSSGP